MKEKYIRYLENDNKYLISIRTRKYTLFSKRVNTLEEAISTRNKFLIDKFGNLDALERKNVPLQNNPNTFILSTDLKYYIGTDSKGNHFIVDSDDIDRVKSYTWVKNQYGYFENPKAGKLHRFILGSKGKEEIDHINRDPSDNRKQNLRFATFSENRQNRGRHKNKKNSIYKGVYFNKECNKYFCEINKNKVLYRSKLFNTEKESAIEYNRLAVELYGINAFQNQIQN